MIQRLLVLGLVMAVVLVVVWLWERRILTAGGLVEGLTVVTSQDCRLCPLAVAATHGAGVPVTIIDIGDLADRAIRSVPTVLVADRRGRVLASRSGRSAVSGMADLIEIARGFA